MAVKAVVLAAGRGVRMGGTEHKALVPVDDHAPLLHYLLASIRLAGIDDLLVVTGHRPQDIQDFVAKEWSGEATFIRNARFASWGNFHSLRLAIDQAPGFDLLALNCDIVVHPDVLKRALETIGDLVLAIERRYRLDAEDMRVELKGNRVVHIGKDLRLNRSHGEFCGVSLLRHDAALLYANVATDFEWRAETSLYYEDVFARMIGNVDVRASEVREGEYAEVDVPEDMRAAARVISRHQEVWEAKQPAVEGA